MERSSDTASRREFLRRSAFALAAFPAFYAGCADTAAGGRILAASPEECEWCGAAEAPPNPPSRVRLAPEGEPGEPLAISGTVYGPDGRTPASGVLLYVYHTDITGYYTTRGDERGNGRRHGRLRAWLKTGADGRYEFRTIKPAPYPNRRDPAHIHMTVAAPGYPEYWIDDIWFEGDPRLTAADREGRPRRGGFPGLVSLERGADGVLRAPRDIRLERVSG